MSFKEELKNIDPSKPCLDFLADRVLSDNYRGMQLSQHNRYTVDDLIILLEEMYFLVSNRKMSIRTTDLKKRPSNTPEEYLYAKYVSNVNAKMSRGTQDSVRKNLFVDLHRMGLINRYNPKGVPLGRYDKSPVKYVSLTSMGIDLVLNKNNPFTKNIIYTKAIDNLTHGFASDLFDIALVDDKGKISIYEFMFFISFIGFSLNGKFYQTAELTDYMIQFRSMSCLQKKAVIRIIDEYCNPKKFVGNKTNKRDFHNWKNESQQIFMLMKDTMFFEQRNETLFVRIGTNGIFENANKLKRSLQAKRDYFINHHIRKKKGFELHHIIPLLIAKTRNEFDVLDVWQNMIYIDGYTHSKLSQTNNKNVVIKFIDSDICLSDAANKLPDIICRKNINVEYDIDNQEIMLNYNRNILASL